MLWTQASPLYKAGSAIRDEYSPISTMWDGELAEFRGHIQWGVEGQAADIALHQLRKDVLVGLERLELHADPGAVGEQLLARALQPEAALGRHQLGQSGLDPLEWLHEDLVAELVKRRVAQQHGELLVACGHQATWVHYDDETHSSLVLDFGTTGDEPTEEVGSFFEDLSL